MTTKNTEAARQAMIEKFQPTLSAKEIGRIFDAGYAAAKEEAWHLIRSEDDLPKVEGEYDVTNMGGKVETGHRISRSSVDNDFWLDNYIAWKPKTAPYTEPQTGGKDD
jgi:hypothetical protein